MSRQVLGQVTPTGFKAKALEGTVCYKQATPYGVYGCALNQTL